MMKIRNKNLNLKLALCAVLVGGAGCSTYNTGSGIDSNGNFNDRIQRHVYAGLGVGASRLEPDTSEVPTANVDDRVEPGGQLTVGMDLSRQVAVELHTADLGSAGISPTGRINYHLTGVSALLYAGKNRHRFKRTGLTGYGRIGAGFLDNSTVGDVNFVQDNQTHLLLGAGVEYMTRLGLGLRAEGIAFDEDVQYAQLGLVYRTGKRQRNRPVEIVQAPEPAPVVIAPPVPAVVVAPKPVDTCSDVVGVLNGVEFHTDSDELTHEAQGVLNGVARRLSECTSVPVRISAHTDSRGADEYNYALSERRADSVVRFLSDYGIDPERLDAQAFGETSPIDTNDTKEGRKRNRRVELVPVVQ